MTGQLFLEANRANPCESRKEIANGRSKNSGDEGRRYTCQHVGFGEELAQRVRGTINILLEAAGRSASRRRYCTSGAVAMNITPFPVPTNSPRLCHCYLLNSPFRSFPLSCPSSLPRDKLSSCFARGTTLVCLGVARPSRPLSLSLSLLLLRNVFVDILPSVFLARVLNPPVLFLPLCLLCSALFLYGAQSRRWSRNLFQSTAMRSFAMFRRFWESRWFLITLQVIIKNYTG